MLIKEHSTFMFNDYMFLKEKRFIQGMTPKEWELNLFKGGLKELSTSVCHPVRTI